MRTVQDPTSATRWLPVYNTESIPVPPFGVMRTTGIDSDGVYQVAQPNADSMTEVLINGPVSIPPLTKGSGHRTDPAQVLIETIDGTPAVGNDYGTEASNWKLRKNKTGFRVLGSVGDNTIEATFYGSSWARLLATVSGSLTVSSIAATVDAVDVLELFFTDCTITQPLTNKAVVTVNPSAETKSGTIYGVEQGTPVDRYVTEFNSDDIWIHGFTGSGISYQHRLRMGTSGYPIVTYADAGGGSASLLISDGLTATLAMYPQSGAPRFEFGSLLTGGGAVFPPEIRLQISDAPTWATGQTGTFAGQTVTSGLITTGAATVPVGSGGTGLTTIPTGAILAGNGTSAVDPLTDTRASGEKLELKIASDRWVAFSMGSF